PGHDDRRGKRPPPSPSHKPLINVHSGIRWRWAAPYDSEPTMLRWMTPFLVAIFVVGTAAAAEGPGATKPTDGPAAAKPADSPATGRPADAPAPAQPEGRAVNKPAGSSAPAKRAHNRAASRSATVRAASQLPPGLPRAHYKYRTTVAAAAPPLYVRQ